ncbi:KAP family P-loop NTPase fold protein [Microbacterium aurantiacum]|uniref:KAP family P-loop NTPase fold protein n=1 Tax=Microbacterium aurantiacum TaxID=162393 RepID=UPI003F490850
MGVGDPQWQSIRARVTNKRVRAMLLREFPFAKFEGTVLRVTREDFVAGDTLGRADLPHSVATAVRALALGQANGSISALVGPWGSGKTWVLDRCLPLLEFPPAGQESVRVVQFNPWLFADESALFAGFADLVLREVRSRRARRRIVRGLRLIGPASKYGPVDLTAAARALGDYLDPPGSPTSIAHAVAQGVRKSRRRVCVVMDDLDRLNPDELVTLFKLIRLLGNLPGVSYLLSLDEETILHLLQNTDIARSDPERARSYLEKVIESKFRIPPLTIDQIHSLAFEPLIAHATANDLTVHKRSMESLEWIFTQSFSRRLTTVRAIERFLVEVHALPPALHGEIDYKDWCLAGFLKTQMPSVWKFVADHKLDFLDKRFRMPTLSQSSPTNHFVEGLPAKLASLGLDSEGVVVAIDVLNAMFPAVSIPGGSELSSKSTSAESERQRGIGHEDYFDRYTWLAFTPEDISDQTVISLLRQLPKAPDPGVAYGDFAKICRDRPRTVLDRIVRNLHDERIDKPALVYALAYLLPLRGSVEDAFERERSPIVLAVGHILASMHDSDADKVFAWAEQGSPVATEIFHEILLREGFFWHSSSPMAARSARLKPTMVARLAERLSSIAAPTIDNPVEREHALVMSRLDPEQFGSLARNLVRSGAWRADDTVALFIYQYRDADGAAIHSGVGERRLREVLGDSFLMSLFPMDGVTAVDRDCLASDANDSVTPSTLSSLRETAAGAVAQIEAHIAAGTAPIQAGE